MSISSDFLLCLWPFVSCQQLQFTKKPELTISWLSIIFKQWCITWQTERQDVTVTILAKYSTTSPTTKATFTYGTRVRVRVSVYTTCTETARTSEIHRYPYRTYRTRINVNDCYWNTCKLVFTAWNPYIRVLGLALVSMWTHPKP